jgi:hypothetical protein
LQFVSVLDCSSSLECKLHKNQRLLCSLFLVELGFEFRASHLQSRWLCHVNHSSSLCFVKCWSQTLV